MIRKVGYVPVCREWPDSLRHPQAKEQLPTSQKVNQDGRLYQLTKYHWLLLHECLETFAHGFSERPMGWLSKTWYPMHRLQQPASGLLLRQDILTRPSRKMSLQQRRMMLIWPETLGLSASFKIHPAELAFTLRDEDLTKDFEEKNEVLAWSA